MLLGSAHAKAAHKTLMKSTLGDRNVFDRKNARCYSNQSYVPTHLSYYNLSTGNAFIYQIIFNNDDQVDSFRSLVNYGESYSVIKFIQIKYFLTLNKNK